MESFTFDSSSMDVYSILGKPNTRYCKGYRRKPWDFDVSWVCKALVSNSRFGLGI